MNAWPLRGGGAPHDPFVTNTAQVDVALAVPSFSHVAPDREKSGSRDRRCPVQSRMGRSLCREQFRWGAPRQGVPRPLSLRRTGGCPIERRLSIQRGSRPNDGFRSFGMFEVVRGRARGNIVCRSRVSARGLEGAREERTNKGLVRVPETRANTCSP